MLRAGDLPARARGRRPGGADPVRGAARGRRRPLDPRIEHRLLAERHLRRDRERERRGGRAQLPVARRAAAARAGGPRAARRRPAPSPARAPSTPTGPSRSGSRCSPATRQFGSIRIGVSTLLVRERAAERARNAARQRSLVALIVSSLVAMLLAQWMLRPIHVIQSGLTRLGRGELDVTLDLPERSSATWAARSTPSARSCPRWAGRIRDRRLGSAAGRPPTSSRSWTTSRTPSRCSRRAAS